MTGCAANEVEEKKTMTTKLPHLVGESLMTSLGLTRDQLVSFLALQWARRAIPTRDQDALVSRLKSTRAEIDDALGYLERE